jgi:hypothetical protein
MPTISEPLMDVKNESTIRKEYLGRLGCGALGWQDSTDTESPNRIRETVLLFNMGINCDLLKHKRNTHSGK